MKAVRRLEGVLAEDLGAIWPDVRELIEQACEKSGDRFKAEHIYNALVLREMQLWVSRIYLEGEPKNIEAVCVTTINNYPGVLVCTVIMVAGLDRFNWMPFLANIEDWAREQGCTKMEAWARPGWERVLNDWEKAKVLLEKEL